MPYTPASRGIEHQQTIGIQIVTVAVAAPKVEGRRASRAEQEAAFLVYRHSAPYIHPTHPLPCIGGPCLISRFTGARDRVEAPDHLAGEHVISPHTSWRGRRRPLAHPHAHDDQIAKDDSWRVGLNRQPGCIPAEVLTQVHTAIVAERIDQPAGTGIDGVQPMSVAKEDAPVRPVRPVGKPAVETVGLERGKAPEFVPGGGIKGYDLRLRSGGVEYAAYDQRIALDLRRALAHVAGVKNPGYIQLGDIGRGNLS